MASVANLLRPGFIDWHRQPHLRGQVTGVPPSPAGTEPDPATRLAEWRQGIVALQTQPAPPGMLAEWKQYRADAARLVTVHGAELARLGWSTRNCSASTGTRQASAWTPPEFAASCTAARSRRSPISPSASAPRPAAVSRSAAPRHHQAPVRPGSLHRPHRIRRLRTLKQ